MAESSLALSLHAVIEPIPKRIPWSQKVARVRRVLAGEVRVFGPSQMQERQQLQQQQAQQVFEVGRAQTLQEVLQYRARQPPTPSSEFASASDSHDGDERPPGERRLDRLHIAEKGSVGEHDSQEGGGGDWQEGGGDLQEGGGEHEWQEGGDSWHWRGGGRSWGHEALGSWHERGDWRWGSQVDGSWHERGEWHWVEAGSSHDVQDKRRRQY